MHALLAVALTRARLLLAAVVAVDVEEFVQQVLTLAMRPGYQRPMPRKLPSTLEPRTSFAGGSGLWAIFSPLTPGTKRTSAASRRVSFSPSS